MSANSLIDSLQSRGWYIALRNINRYIFHNEWLQQLPHSGYANRYKHVDSEDSQEAPNKRISFRNSRKCESRSRHCQQQSASFSLVFLFGSFVQSFDVRKLVMWYHGMMWIVELRYYYYSEGYFFFVRFFFVIFFFVFLAFGSWLLLAFGFCRLLPRLQLFFLILASVASSAASTAEQ